MQLAAQKPDNPVDVIQYGFRDLSCPRRAVRQDRIHMLRVGHQTLHFKPHGTQILNCNFGKCTLER